MKLIACFELFISLNEMACNHLAALCQKGYKNASCSLKGASGVQDLYFVFQGDGFTWDWWQMK